MEVSSFLIDSHCHIHDDSFAFTKDILEEAKKAGVRQIVCIGTSAEDSEKAVQFCQENHGCFASIGLHPHDASMGEDDLEVIARLAIESKVVAIGEFGLDYYYDNSPRKDQLLACEYQMDLAIKFNKPCVFHIRDAFDDFWPVYDNFPGLKGVIHSFTSTKSNVTKAVDRGLYLGLNGIMTFTKDASQHEAAREIPLDNLLLETDSPFLTPNPLRGKMNVPANVGLVAAYLAELRGEPLDTLIEATTRNTQRLFSLSDELI